MIRVNAKCQTSTSIFLLDKRLMPFDEHTEREAESTILTEDLLVNKFTEKD